MTLTIAYAEDASTEEKVKKLQVVQCFCCQRLEVSAQTSTTLATCQFLPLYAPLASYPLPTLRILPMGSGSVAGQEGAAREAHAGGVLAACRERKQDRRCAC
eukprot:3551746-Rhodomonas_salina.1